MKKLLGVVFVLVVILAGCQSGSKNSDVVTEITEPVTVSFWHAMNGEHEKILTSLTNEFNEQSEFVTVELVNQADYPTLQTKINAAGESKTLPTMAQAYSNWMYEYDTNEWLTDLTPYFENETIGLDQEVYVDAFLDELKFNDALYGVPFNKSTEVLYINESILKDSGAKVPTTPTELKETSSAMFEKTKKPGIGFDSLPNYFSVATKLCGFDDWVDAESKIVFNDECIAKGVTAYQDGIKDGWARVAGEDKYLSGPFGNGDLGMNIGSTAGAPYIAESVDGKFDFKIAPYPATVAPQQGTSLTMFNSATPQEQAGAWEFMKFITNDTNTTTWAIGTGYLPVTKTAFDTKEYQDYMKDNEVARVSFEQLDAMSVVVPVFGGSNEIYNTNIGDFMSATLEAAKDVKTELETLTQTSQTVYDRNN